MHTSRGILKRILTELGHEVVGEARNGEEAIEMVRATLPDAAIFDISMPGKYMGDAAARLVRAENPNVIIFISSNIDNTSVRRPLETEIGAHFVIKPFRAGQMTLALERVLGA